ncbi:winged helix-turn-helix domain-containing protein, partial [Candidatus Collinsella stercoripullorum]
LSKRGEPVALTAAELKIMAAFMSAPGRVFSKDQLYACVNGEPAVGGAGSVMVHISNIRAKLEDDPLRPRFIKTVRGLGYRLDG